MRYSIRFLMLTTLVTAIVWLPAAALIKWMSDPKTFAYFGLGQLHCFTFIVHWNLAELYDEFERVSRGNNDYIDDYISGHILAWTLVAIFLWATTLFMCRCLESIANSDYVIRLDNMVFRWRRRRRSKNRACRRCEKELIRESISHND